MAAAAADRVQVIGAWTNLGRQGRLCGRHIVQVRYIAKIDQSASLRFHK